jgi:starch synthase (maltosyl-transferring)
MIHRLPGDVRVRIYNLFPRLAGPMPQWTGHFDRAAAMAFDWIFLNPVQKPGSSGSLYSVADPFSVDPRIVDPDGPPPAAQLRAAISEARARGLRVMADLVINHCAADAPVVREHPAWFRWQGGEVEHPGCDENGSRVVWTDLARFDYAGTSDPAGLVEHAWRIVAHLADLGFDGFRCDAAYQVPDGVWRTLLERGRALRPGLVFAAETLGCTADQTCATARAGFDLVFNSGKWWDFSSPWLMEQYTLIRETCGSIGFPESHDTARLFEESGGSVAAMKQRYLFAALFSTGVLMPVGFEFGFRRRLHVVHTGPGDWESPGCDLTGFIRRTNKVKRDHAVFREECPSHVIPWENPNLLVMWRGALRSPEEALLVLNKDVHNYQPFHAHSLRPLVQSGAALRCVSPENPLAHVPEPFDYGLRPGEGIVLVARR